MFGQLIATLKKSPKTIVFTEGTDPRILEASARLLSGNFLKPVLVGNPEEIAAAAEDAGFNIRGAEIADPANLLHRGHRASRTAAHQDQARQQHSLLLLHHGPSRRVR